MHTTQFNKIFKVAHNRGKPRVWIEGKFLSQAKISIGEKFVRLMPDPMDDEQVMILRFISWGNHSVSGKGERPIIDLNGNYLKQIFGNATHYSARIFVEHKESEPIVEIHIQALTP